MARLAPDGIRPPEVGERRGAGGGVGRGGHRRAKAGVVVSDAVGLLHERVEPARVVWRTAGGRDVYVATPAIRKPLHFAKLNLMESWPMQGPFDAILCRNVMIYFDKATQQKLIERYWALLRPGGHLLVGHSESLTGLTHRFRYVQPAIYVK